MCYLNKKNPFDYKIFCFFFVLLFHPLKLEGSDQQMGKNYYCPVWVIVFKIFSRIKEIEEQWMKGKRRVFHSFVEHEICLVSDPLFSMGHSEWCSHLHFLLYLIVRWCIMFPTENAQFKRIRSFNEITLTNHCKERLEQWELGIKLRILIWSWFFWLSRAWVIEDL